MSNPRFHRPKVKWKRYRTAKALALRFFNMDPKYPVKDLSEVGMGGVDSGGAKVEVDGHVVLRTIIAAGMWAFVDGDAKPPVIHYWHDGKRKLDELAFMLGHELGHVTGKSARSGSWKEEVRADEYGAVAAEVFRLMKRDR